LLRERLTVTNRKSREYHEFVGENMKLINDNLTVIDDNLTVIDEYVHINDAVIDFIC